MGRGNGASPVGALLKFRDFTAFQAGKAGQDSQTKGARRRSDAPSQGIFYSSMSSYSREPMPSAAAASTMRTPLRDSMRSNRWARPGSLEA